MPRADTAIQFYHTPSLAQAAAGAGAKAVDAAKGVSRMTIGERYASVMEIIDQPQADECFQRLVQERIEAGKSRKEAERLERASIGYYAGYYSHEVRERVERLFNCAHPVFGSIAENGTPTLKEALDAGKNLAAKRRNK